MYLQKREQAERYGLNVPTWLQDEREEWRLRWLAKFYEELADVESTESHDELMFQLLLKKSEIQRKDQLK